GGTRAPDDGLRDVRERACYRPRISLIRESRFEFQTAKTVSDPRRGRGRFAATTCLNGCSSKLKARGSELFGNLQIPFHVIAPGKTRKGANHEKDSTRFGNSGHDRP